MSHPFGGGANVRRVGAKRPAVVPFLQILLCKFCRTITTGDHTVKRFVIEREMPAVGTLEREQMRAAAEKSNSVLRELGPDIQWMESARHAGQDLLRLSGEGRGADPQARRDERLSGQQDFRGQAHDRSDDGGLVVCTAASPAWVFTKAKAPDWKVRGLCPSWSLRQRFLTSNGELF